jgi:hypothetical protein
VSGLSVIKRSNHRENESSFARLREEGVRLAQAASGDRWTDYNLHDPGVTLLEQLCYGLTDIAYRVDFPVADHMSGPGDVIAFGQLALHPPDVIFPCRPTTALDYRRVLLDQVEGLDDAQLTLLDHVGLEAVRAPAGVYRLMLRLVPPVASGVDSRAVDARAAYCAYRNLCEDIDPNITTVREVSCQLHGHVELSGPRDGVDVLADIYDRCARVIAQTPVYRSAGELIREGQTVEKTFTGPRTPNGVICEPRSADASHRLFVSTLMAVVGSIDGVGPVGRLALQREDAPYETDSLQLRGVDWALRLHVPRNASEVRAGAIQLTRRGKPVVIAVAEVYDKYEKLQARARAQGTRTGRGASQAAPGVGEPETDLGYELPKGSYRDLQRYHSVQEHFPPIYHLGPHTLAEHAPPGERAQVKQLKAYLLLFEQMIANSAARVQHLRELFTVDAAARGIWWQGLGDDSAPGVEALYREQQSPDQVAATAFAPFDRYIERKSRALDHLLGLHGETYAQNSLRQFYGHTSPDEIDVLLLQNKVAYLRDIVELNRDRAGAFNYGQTAWNADGNCSGLHKRLCVLLGFPPARIRPLTEALRRQRRRLTTRLPEREPRGAPESVTPDHIRHSVPAGYRTRVHSHAEIERHLGRVHWTRGSDIPAAFFRVGAHADRYHMLVLGGRCRLLLGPDEDDRWWNLGDDFATEDEALRAADSVRYFLRRLNDLSEGLHVVEHVLLRPFGTDVGHTRVGVPSDFYAFRLTVVLPAWTVRTCQQSFRAFAEETIAINCPAHIVPRVLWLDYTEMAAFEHLYEAWLEAKQRWFNEQDVTAQSYGVASERLDNASCRLIEVLQARPPGLDYDYFSDQNPGDEL